MHKVTIIGLGFVGLSLISFLSSKKIMVVGIDSNKKKIEQLKKGKADFFEPDLEKFLKNGRKFQRMVSQWPTTIRLQFPQQLGTWRLHRMEQSRGKGF